MNKCPNISAIRLIGALLCVWAASRVNASDERLITAGGLFPAHDTLAPGVDANEDSNACLAELCWKPTKFAVRLEAAQRDDSDFLVRFPSPRPIGDVTNDLVSMEWYAARDARGIVKRARAIVVVHESAHSMPVGRLIARSLSWQGLHAFLIHLPGYGNRRAMQKPASFDQVLPMMTQGIADVRRARDAVVALPVVDQSMVGVEGTSLGGFVTATVAGLDHGFDRVFILLAGGNIEDVLFHGSRDAAKVREKLHASGITDLQIKKLAHTIEPLRLARRIDPTETWLFSGTYDTVVPPRCSLALAKSAGLADDHHVEFPADHYLGIIYLPPAIQQISQRMLETTNNRAANSKRP
jgi:dienelactone hydrolase